MTAKKKEPKKIGRPSKYELNEENILRIAQVSYKLGATDAQIAEQLGVEQRTIDNWKKTHPQFFQSLKTAKDIADDEVEKSLLARAKGFETKDGKHFPPDTTACIFWLKNRRPKDWREKSEVETTVTNFEKLDFAFAKPSDNG